MTSLLLVFGLVLAPVAARNHLVSTDAALTTCGFALEDLYLNFCPNVATLPVPGIQGPCEPYTTLAENFGIISCSNSWSVLAVYGKSYDNTTQGWWFGNQIFCDPSNDQYWLVGSIWGKSYKFNPHRDRIVCLQNVTSMVNAQFNLPTCRDEMIDFVSVPENCPANFSTLSLYTPSTSTQTPIDGSLAATLAAGCTGTALQRTPWVDSYSFPSTGFNCRTSLFLVQGSNVIQLKNLICRSPDFLAVAEDESLITVNTASDYVFCSLTPVPTDFACPSLTPTNECPTLVDITSYSADGVPVPFFQSGLIASNPQCLQNYTILRSGYADNKITCYEPGTDLNGDKENHRLLMLISDNGTYHLTRSITCSDQILSINEGFSYAFQPGATFTCVDSLAAYDAILISQGIQPDDTNV